MFEGYCQNRMFRFMKRFYLLLLILMGFGMLGLPDKAGASHLVGADIQYKCLGGDTVYIDVVVYRDCLGIPLGADQMFAKSECGTTVNPSVSMGNGVDITPRCKSTCTTCESQSCAYNIGIEQYHITATLVLKGCCKWTVGWQQSARNGAITTMQGGDLYTDAKLDMCQKPCDNSPYFTNPPVGVFCKDQCVVINPGANDDDKNGRGESDSLVYAFADPLGSNGTTLQYNSGYSKSEPLVYVGKPDKDADFNPPLCAGFHLDTETGDVSFKATKTDVTVFAFKVESWRRDSLGVPRKIGEIRRDLQIRIIDCPENRPPQIIVNSGLPNNAQPKIFDFCVDEDKCIGFVVFDQDVDDSVTVNWNKQIPGGKWTTTKQPEKKVTATFCWKPGKKDIRSQPHQFTVTALDNACPVPGRTSKTIRIRVNPSPEATTTIKVGNCGEVSFEAYPTGEDDQSFYDYTWTGTGGVNRVTGVPQFIYVKGSSAKAKYTAGGRYGITLSIVNKKTNCTFSKTDSFDIPPIVGVDLPKDTSVCVGTSFNIKGVRRDGNPPFTYTWSNGSTADNITPTITKDTFFTLVIQDGNKCTNWDTIFIKGVNLPKPRLGPSKRKCSYDTAFLDPKLGRMKKVNWYRQNADGSYSLFDTGATLVVRDSGNYRVEAINMTNCAGYDSIKVRFNPTFKVWGRTEKVCLNTTRTISSGLSGPQYKFEWFDLRGQRVVSRDSVFRPLSVTGTREYEVTVTQTMNGLACVRKDTIVIDTAALPRPKISNFPPVICINNPDINLKSFVSTPGGGEYAIYSVRNQPQATGGSTLYPSKLPKGNYMLRYTLVNKFQCTVTDSVPFAIDTLPIIGSIPDTIICTKGGPIDLRGYPVGGSWTAVTDAGKAGLQAGNNTTFFNPERLAPNVTYELTYTYTDKNGGKCTSKKNVKITVLTTPTIEMGNYGPYCDNRKDNERFPLVAKPAGGRWMPGAGTPADAIVKDGPGSYYFVPSKAKEGQHTLVYEVFNTYNNKEFCTVRDSALVIVRDAATITLQPQSGKKEFCQTEPLEPISITSSRTGGTGNIRIDGSARGIVGNDYRNMKIDFAQLAPGEHTLTFNYTTKEGCPSTVDYKFKVFPRPSVNIITAGEVCEGETFDLSGTAQDADRYEWIALDGGQFIGSTSNLSKATFRPSAQQASFGRFTVGLIAYATGSPCPSDTAIKTFRINPKPVSSFEADITNGCAPLTVKFRSRSALATTWMWDFGDGTTETTQSGVVSHYYSEPGTYTVKLKIVTPFGCTDEKVMTNYIEVYPSPIPDFRAIPQSTSIGTPKIDFVSEPYSKYTTPLSKYTWNFGDRNAPGGGTSDQKNPTHSYSDTGKYTVSLKIKNENGCQGDTVKIAYVDIRPEIIVFIPNAFTPDGMNTRLTGGHNEKFTPYITHYKSAVMRVYNRWGQELYSTTNPTQEGWDGTYKGEPVGQGVYAYVIEAYGLFGKKYTFTGTITLIK